MNSLAQQLAALNPPLQHIIESQGETIIFTLMDPQRQARVSRRLSKTLVDNTQFLYVVIRDAVNEIRALGSQTPITSKQIYSTD